MELVKTIDRNNDRLFKKLRAKVKHPYAFAYREWNAAEPEKMSEIAGRVPKFMFTLLVVLANAVLAILLFFLSSNLFSWLFFALVLSSLIPKVTCSSGSPT